MQAHIDAGGRAPSMSAHLGEAARAGIAILSARAVSVAILALLLNVAVAFAGTGPGPWPK